MWIASSRFQSWLSKCRRSVSTSSLSAPWFLSRSWWNSWWKYRRPYPTLRYSGLWSSTSTFQFRRGGGGPSSGLQGFSSGQSSTASPSKKRISERIVEQIVDPVSRGGLHGSSSSHSPAGDEERADEPGKGVFRTFPQNKKVRSWARTRGRNCFPGRAHLRRLLSWRTPSSGCCSRTATLASLTTGTDVLSVQSGSLRLALRLCGSAKGMRREGSGTGTGKRACLCLTSLLFLLGEVLTASPGRYINTGWASYLPVTMQRLVPAVLRASWPVWTRRAVAVVCIRRVLLVPMHLALYFFPWLAGPGCSAFWPVWTRTTVAVACTS